MTIVARVLTNIGGMLVQSRPVPGPPRFDRGYGKLLAGQLPLAGGSRRSLQASCELGRGGSVRLNVSANPQSGFRIGIARVDRREAHTASHIFEHEIAASTGEIRELIKAVRAMYGSGNWWMVSWSLNIIVDQDLEQIRFFDFWHHANKQSRFSLDFSGMSVGQFNKAYLATTDAKLRGRWLVCDGFIRDSLDELVCAGGVLGDVPLPVSVAINLLGYLLGERVS